MHEIHPNLIAYAALFSWPFIALFLYSRLPIGQATIWTILGAFLLLPVRTEVKLQMIPALDKQSIPSIVALVGCMLCSKRLPQFFRGFGIADFLLLGLLVGPFITSMLNGDAIQMGEMVLPGVGPYDAGSASLAQFVALLPFFIGRQFLRGAKENEDILRALVIAGLVYSLPMLFEIRMSPQLHTWIYGYAPSDFIQEVRLGGYRPVVFLGHGLLTAFFIMSATVASAAFLRTQTRVTRWPPGGVTSYLGFILLLCKTGSSFVYGAVLFPLVRWATPRAQLRVACVLVMIALTYPVLRITDMFPTTSIVETASSISVSRAASLETRFRQEQRLLDHAWERPWFGWGRYGRNRLYNGWQGRDDTITDGYWIIKMGTFGLVGFISAFGLLGLSVFRAAMALKFAPTMQEAIYLGTLTLIIAANIVDLLPNSSISAWTWLLVGALLGRAEMLIAVARQTRSEHIARARLAGSQTGVA